MFEYSYRTGLLGSLWTMQAAIPYMKAQADGRIINFCSLQGVDGEPLFGDYDSTKEAIRGLTRTVAREWGRFGVQIGRAACGVRVWQYVEISGVAGAFKK